MSNPLPLRDYQIADLTFLMMEKRTALLHDPGGGKTPPVCVYIEWLWRDYGQQSIWVMPKSLLRKNRDELLRFTNFEPEHIAIVDGPKWKEALEQRHARVFLVGPTRFRMSWEEFRGNFGAILGDETHMYWTTNSSQAVSAWYQAQRRIPRYVGMTGTMINGRLDSAYPTIQVIEPRYYGSYKGFLNEHAILDDYDKPVAWKNPGKIAAIFGKHAIRRTFESIYGKEAKVIIPQKVEMSPAQRKAYDEFEEKALLELEDRFLDSGGIGAIHALRCRQIMAHPETFGLLPKGEVTGKDAMLQVHLADHKNSGKPFLIYAAFVPEQERIFKLVQESGMSCALMNGSTPSAKRPLIDEAFRAGRIQVVVGSPQVTAVGYNWGHVDHICFTTLDYQDSSFVQGYRRAVRGKRDVPLRISVLQYADSRVENRVMQIIKTKSQLAADVDGAKEVFDFSVA